MTGLCRGSVPASRTRRLREAARRMRLRRRWEGLCVGEAESWLGPWVLRGVGVGGCRWHGRGNSPGVCILGRGQGTALRRS